MKPARKAGRASADQARFTRLAETAGPRLLAYLARRVDPPGDAADLLAEALATAWRRVADLPADDGPAVAWLFGIARGTLANHRRGQARRHALADRLRDHLEPRLQAAAPPADEAVAVRDALKRLAPDDRELLTVVEGADHRQELRHQVDRGQQPQPGQRDRHLGPAGHPRVAPQPPDGGHAVGHDPGQVTEQPGRQAPGQDHQQRPAARHQPDGQQQPTQPAAHVHRRTLVENAGRMSGRSATLCS